MISTLSLNDNVTLCALCKSFNRLTTKAGKDYYSMSLCDASGSITAKDWNCVSPNDIKPGVPIEVTADVVEFSGELQLRIISCKISDADPLTFCPVSKYEEQSMLKALCSILDTVEDVWCQKLIHHFLQDEEFMHKFMQYSAARSIHHDCVHGLLEHTLHVVRLSSKVSVIYDWLNKDLLITAAFLHDIGKLHELQPFPVNDYTDFGNYVGHVVGSTIMVQNACNQIQGFPEDILLKILHCILAHHGKLEWGSPKLPALPEAFVISQMDNLDARLKIFEKSLANSPMSEWTKFVNELGTKTHTGQFEAAMGVQ